ncbi:MAG TPA: hypothetical protein VN040_14150 [Pseudosphingobacterium sp.]|nr:hypothetical protein [Pseudosphingobacterium sp.]
MKKWGKILLVVLLSLSISLPPQKAEAVIPLAIIEVIKAGIKKVIKAVDLKIQRLQNKTIWLQNAQKVLENQLSKLKLGEIGDWAEKQKEQYRVYFEELQKVKTLITYYQRIRDITSKQVRLVEQYNRAWNTVRQDKNFTVDEVRYMGKVYTGILAATIKNIDQLAIIVNSFRTQMSDAKRLEMINTVGDQVDKNFSDLKSFNGENAILSLQRAKTENEIKLVKKLYGLQDN